MELRLYYPIRHAEFISASKSELTLRDPETRSVCGSQQMQDVNGKLV